MEGYSKLLSEIESNIIKQEERRKEQIDATLAQLEEHLICNQAVVGSNPTGGSK